MGNRGERGETALLGSAGNCIFLSAVIAVAGVYVAGKRPVCALVMILITAPRAFDA